MSSTHEEEVKATSPTPAASEVPSTSATEAGAAGTEAKKEEGMFDKLPSVKLPDVNVSKGLSDAGDSAKAAMSSIGSGFGSFFSKVASTVGDAAEKAASTAREAAEATAKATREAANATVNAASSAANAAGNVAGGVPGLGSLTGALSDKELNEIDQLFRAANYLTVGQIYLRENVFLQEPLKVEHIKPRLLGHFGTSPGLSMIYLHMNRLIKKKDLDAIFLTGPGHGGPAIVAQTYLEGTYTEIYPSVGHDLAGLRKLFRQFSQPGGIPSHVSPNVPGSINEGGELGYVLTHAFGAVMDNPNLLALAVVGDGEAETGPLEGSWKGISFINPVHDGAVLPVLHLNGYKISGPTVLGRETDANIESLFKGHGYEVHFVEGTDVMKVHQDLAKTMESCVNKIQEIQNEARAKGVCNVRPRWPMIILRTPKGWTGPQVVDGKKIEGTFRAHQVPLATVRENPEHLAQLEKWLKSYKAEELFDVTTGKLKPELAALAPVGNKRMSAQPYTNGGLEPKALVMPDITAYALDVSKPATDMKQSVAQLGQFCRDLYKLNPHNFRLMCPDETNSNRLGAVFETQSRASMQATHNDDEKVAHSGRVMEVLSEHNICGWLEGYVLTGRHGLLATYEAFAMIFISMTLQMVKWFEVVAGTNGELDLPWRKQIPSINILLTSTCWRNDHNGFSHQGPSFVDVLLSKKGDITRAYFPCDANTLLVTAEHCLGGHNRVNVIVQDKQPQFQYLSLADARAHFEAKISRWAFASNDKPGTKPDVVMACCGDVLTAEALAATAFLREHAPEFTVRFVNVIDLMAMYEPEFHPHGLSNEKFDEVFTRDVEVVFAYHAYPGSLHQLLHNRSNVTRFHVRGYQENGTTTTPFDMVVLNQASRYHLVQLAMKHTKNAPANKDAILQKCEDLLKKHKTYVVEEMQDMPEVTEFKWNF